MFTHHQIAKGWENLTQFLSTKNVYSLKENNRILPITLFNQKPHKTESGKIIIPVPNLTKMFCKIQTANLNMGEFGKIKSYKNLISQDCAWLSLNNFSLIFSLCHLSKDKSLTQNSNTVYLSNSEEFLYKICFADFLSLFSM